MKKQTIEYPVEVYAGSHGESFIRTDDGEESVFLPDVTNEGWKPGDKATLTLTLITKKRKRVNK